MTSRSILPSYAIDNDQIDDYGYSYSHNFGRTIMPTIQASEFKAKCLALMDKVAATGLRPYSGGRKGSPFGLHQGLEIRGDVIAPLEDDLWNALG